MIKINYNKSHTDILIKGHANYQICGKDVVCASVSSIVITTINGLINLKQQFSYDEKDGYIHIMIEKETFEISALLNNMIELLKELEKQYPKNIKINEEV